MHFSLDVVNNTRQKLWNRVLVRFSDGILVGLGFGSVVLAQVGLGLIEISTGLFLTIIF